MSKFPSLSSKELLRLLEKGGAVFVRQGATDHAIYARVVEGRRYSAPVQTGKKTLDPVYCKRVFRQLKFSDQEIEGLTTKKPSLFFASEPKGQYLAFEIKNKRAQKKKRTFER
jgi:predicted RNA binding protein YcfA (HicA-like mRNA interferase family)